MPSRRSPRRSATCACSSATTRRTSSRRRNGATRPSPRAARPTSCARAGSTADADKFDNLAKIALQRQISEESEAAQAVEPTIAAQTEVVDKLKVGLNGMKQKLGELKSKRSELLARAKTAEAQNKVADAVKSIDVLDPTSELGRFEDKVRRQEALAAGKQELAASRLDAQFESLEDVGELTEVEARLAALKAGAATAQVAIDAPSVPYTP